MIYRQNLPLALLCDIQTGYTARSRVDVAAEGGVPALQLRDLQGEGEFDLGTAPFYALDGKLERYRAGPGDILFRSRGEQNTAIAVADSDAQAAVAIMPLMILRPDSELVDPYYLAWFINQPTSQRHFDACAQGQRLRMIGRPCLENLEVALPDLKTQRLIVEIDRLASRESALLNELAKKKKQLTSFALMDQVRKAQPHGNEAGPSVARQKQRPAGMSERTNR